MRSSVSSNVSGANLAVPGDDLVRLSRQSPEFFAALAAVNADMSVGAAQALDELTAGAIVSPVGAIINAGGPGFGHINDTFNHHGLTAGYSSGVTDFDAYLATTPRHSMIFLGFEWFSNAGTTGATITYDLGSVIAIDGLALWNEEGSGIGTLHLFSSTDGATFTPVATSLHPTDNALAAPLDSPPYPADVFGFACTSARFVRLVISGSPQPKPGSFPAAAIGEVAFRHAAERCPVQVPHDQRGAAAIDSGDTSCVGPGC